MQKQFYFLSPVEVVRVTAKNLEEVAEWCGGKVAATESRKVPGRQDSYVWVPTPKGTTISWAFPGMFITKRLVRTIKDELRVTYAVYRKDYFEKNYFDSPTQAVDETWERDAVAKKAKAALQSIKSKALPPIPEEDIRDAEEAAKVLLEAMDKELASIPPGVLFSAVTKDDLLEGIGEKVEGLIAEQEATEEAKEA